MKIVLLVLCLLRPFAAFGQTSAITATVTDTDGTAWATLNGFSATYSIILVNAAGQAIPAGQAFRIDTGATITVAFSGNMSNVGAMSLTLTSSSNIRPAGTQWKFVVCSAIVQTTCSTTVLAVNASGSLSTQLSTNAAPLRVGGGWGSYAYADVEVAAIPNNSYYNITTPALRCYGASWAVCGNGGGSSLLSQKVVYVSKLNSIPASTAVVPGSSASGTTDSASIINTALSGGNVDLEVDGGYALSTSLVVSSNTTIHCLAPQFGFIMQAAANTPVVVNAHQNAPTTADGTGGYVVSNQTDQNIGVQGCQLNDNSLQSVTGSNSSGVPHAINPTTGLYVPATLFTGVNGLRLDDNEIYDGGAYGINGANDSQAHIDRNFIHNPLPIVQEKNTDGIDFTGPDLFFWIDSNRINSGDDAIDMAAEGCNLIHSGYTPLPECAIPGFLWGQIQHVHIDHTILDGASFGIRLLDANEFEDDISVSHTTGSVCGNAFTMAQYFPTAVGLGNIGRVSVNDWKVQTTGTCNVYSQPYNFELGLVAQMLTIEGVEYVNPTVNWPIIETLSSQAAPGILQIRNLNATTTSSTFSPSLIVTNATGGMIQADGISWNDSIGTGNVFSGSAVPGTLTISNYSGPNLLLPASGYVPTNKNGDAFTNAYASTTTTYLNSIFNEAGSGNLSGTTPATCTNGCTGSWAITSGSIDYTYQSGGGILASATSRSTADLINAGPTNYTLRLTVGSTPTAEADVNFRYTDANNYTVLAIDFTGGGCTALFDIVAGSASPIGSQICGTQAGNYTVVVDGTSLSLTAPAGTTSGTTANTGTIIGPSATSASSGVKFTSMSVKSN